MIAKQPPFNNLQPNEKQDYEHDELENPVIESSKYIYEVSHIF